MMSNSDTPSPPLSGFSLTCAVMRTLIPPRLLPCQFPGWRSEPLPLEAPVQPLCTHNRGQPDLHSIQEAVGPRIQDAHTWRTQPEEACSMQISRLVFGDRLDRRTNMRRARCALSRAQAASCACSRRRKGRGCGGGRRGRRPCCSMGLGKV